MKGLGIFLFITIATLFAIIATFILLYIGWIGNEVNPLTHSDKVQALTSILALVIGTAAALGSAIATLKVASLGLEISHQQERRDNIEFVDNKVESSIEIFSEVAISIGEIFSTSILVESKIPQFDKTDALNKMNEDVDSELKITMNQLADKISKLSEQLKTIMKHEFSRTCYYRSAKELNSKCDILNKKLTQIDNNSSNHSVYTIDISNISDITSLLDIAQVKVRKAKLGILLTARLLSKYPDTIGIPYNNSNVRSFSFLGFLILYISSENSPLFFANYGAAILHDLFYALPNGKIFDKELNSRYSNLFTDVQSKVDFEPTEICSKYFRLALVETEKIGDLYLLVNKN